MSAAGDFAVLDTEGARSGVDDLDALPTTALVELFAGDLAAVEQALRAAAPAIAVAIDAAAQRMASGGRLIYLGAGTSGRLAVVDAAECGPTFNAPPEQVQAIIAGGPGASTSAIEASEDDEDDARAQLRALELTAGDVVMGLSASGRTRFVLAGIEAARAAGALTIGAACNAGSPLAARVDHAIETPVGSELLAGSTRLKCGTAQKVLLNAVSTIAMVRLGKTFRNLMVDVRPTNAKLVERAVRIVREVTGAADDTARGALAATENDVKAAVLVIARTLGPEDARALLARHGGRLRAALEA